MLTLLSHNFQIFATLGDSNLPLLKSIERNPPSPSNFTAWHITNRNAYGHQRMHSPMLPAARWLTALPGNHSNGHQHHDHKESVVVTAWIHHQPHTEKTHQFNVEQEDPDHVQKLTYASTVRTVVILGTVTSECTGHCNDHFS